MACQVVFGVAFLIQRRVRGQSNYRCVAGEELEPFKGEEGFLSTGATSLGSEFSMSMEERAELGVRLTSFHKEDSQAPDLDDHLEGFQEASMRPDEL